MGTEKKVQQNTVKCINFFHTQDLHIINREKELFCSVKMGEILCAQKNRNVAFFNMWIREIFLVLHFL